MPAYRDKERNTWFVAFYYKTWNGEHKQKRKRGFKTKRDALDYELRFKQTREGTLDMKFEDFVEMYFDDISPKLKLNTLMTKKTVISKKITPYFKGKPMNEIKACDIVKWQNEMMEFVNEKGKPYSKKSLQGMQSQLSAIFNHAVRLYELDKNPVRIAGPIGGESEVKEMQIWTTEEYKKFSEAISDKPQAFYAFEVLYWTGIRLGELLALTVSDFDFKKQTMRIDKSLQNIKGKVYVTTPKTVMSNRTVKIPEFLCHEIQEYIEMMYGIRKGERIFQFTKSYLHHQMIRGSKLAGVKRIRIHDLRHSHISLLIEMGFTPVDIAKRVGHENINITMHYAHMFPQKQDEMIDKLEDKNNLLEEEISWTDTKKKKDLMGITESETE